MSQELIEHHSQIVAKFVRLGLSRGCSIAPFFKRENLLLLLVLDSIVGDFVDASATKLKLVDWDRSQNTSTLNGRPVRMY